jgi:hypothetical protein
VELYLLTGHDSQGSIAIRCWGSVTELSPNDRVCRWSDDHAITYSKGSQVSTQVLCGPLTLGARGGVQTQYITNTLQGNGQRTYKIPTWNILRTFRIFPANLTEISPVQEMLRTFIVYPGDFLIRKCVGKFKVYLKNVPTVFLGSSFKVFFAMSPAK